MNIRILSFFIAAFSVPCFIAVNGENPRKSHPGNYSAAAEPAEGQLIVASIPSIKPPTMGWSSWNCFGGEITSKKIKAQADAMVSTGLADVGYEFINIDDCYQNGRFSNGSLRWNTIKFPNGMGNVARYIHNKGLKAGIYSDAGDNTCGSQNKGSWGLGVGFVGHEEADCETYFDKWDYDFIKVDWCGGSHANLKQRDQYTKISEAINSVDKKGIVFNVCCWAYPGTWISDIADSWRTTADIRSNWPIIKKYILENLYIQAYTGGGHYNDMDMLELGVRNTPWSQDTILTNDEETTHMAYWCIASSPLLIGCDMTNIPEESLALLKNVDLIAMNQDGLGIGAPVVQRKDEVYVVAKDMEIIHGSKRAVVVMNLSNATQTIDLSLEALGFADGVKFYDCLTHADAATGISGTYRVTIPAHGSRAYFVTGRRIEQKRYQAEEAWCHDYNEIGTGTSPQWVTEATADLGEYMGYLGNSADNYLEWRKVYSENGGSYTMSIRYASGEARGMTVSVNGQTVKSLSGLNSGNFTTRWNTVDVNITLSKGVNTIRLSNADGWMPNIDCMTLTR